MNLKHYLHNTTGYLVIMLIILIGTIVISSTSVFADHTVPHCREMYDEQVPQAVVDECQDEVRERCAELYLPNNEVGYQVCINGTSPGGSSEDENFPTPQPIGDPEGLSDCNGIAVSIDVGCDENASNPILGYLGGIINFLAGGVLIVVVVMIAAAGVEYITSRGVPQKVEDAKRRITNAILALVTFIFMYAILQWLIPGGIF